MEIPDGFIKIEADYAEPHLLNTDPIINEFSPFCSPENIVMHPDGCIILDRNYGQLYNQMEIKPAAIYGRTHEIPMFSGDQLENYGYLRVPFRRIPRRLVRDRAEVEAILSSIRSADSNLKILLRGQTSEYLVKRSPKTSQLLFGEDAVLEPSIVTSAARRGPALETVIPEWMALLKIFLTLDGRLSKDQYAEFSRAYSTPMFALALAQHYGLPTSGIDVTTDLDVALFFALMKYEKVPGTFKATYSPLGKTVSPPVIYVMSVSMQQQFDYQGFAPPSFPSGRPEAQKGYFMHVGWGNAINTCARRVFLALYLDPEGDFGELPDPSLLFPNGQIDRFAQFLEMVASSGLPSNLKQAFESGFYVLS